MAGCVMQVAAQRASPVIGIISQPKGSKQDEYVIAASYVKWLEAGGARSIPIPYDAPPSLVEELFGQINGLLLPGGASDVPESVWFLLTLALQESVTRGEAFPVWGTCLGFEYLIQYMSNTSTASSPILSDGFDAENISLPLYDIKQQGLYQHDRMFDIVENFNVTMNNHFKGVHPQRFQSDPLLSQYWYITSTNYDRRGKLFVSTIEPKDPTTFPWYGVQYHPEKNAFEYGSYPGTNIPYEAIDHSEEAVEFSLYLARFFVRLVSKKINQQLSAHAYTKPDIYPLVSTYPMKLGVAFEQYYAIPSAEQRSRQSFEQRHASS